MTDGNADVAGFADAARRFCRFVEGAGELSLGERLLAARELLAELVLAGCRLPEGDADAPDVEGEVQADFAGFGELDIYWEIFDPYADKERVAGSLSDDVLDVYRDLARGLVAYDAGNAGGAVWDWRFHFDHHWGHHAVDALRALQRACVERDGD